MRWNDWKIVRTAVDVPWQLFNLKEDISESDDKAMDRTDLVEKLDSMFIARQREITESNGTDSRI